MIKLITFLLVFTFINSQTSPLPSTSTEIDAIYNLDLLRKTELGRHNAYRRLHGVPPLVLNDSLNSMAQNYSVTLFKARNLVHSSSAISGQYGENLFKSRGSTKYNFPADGPSGSWYSQIANYNFSSGEPISPEKMIYHFTAMIWKEVQQVGFGFTFGPQKNGYAIYAVAIYTPTPNMLGSFISNVLPIIGQTSNGTTNFTSISNTTNSSIINNTTINSSSSPNISQQLDPAKLTLNTLRRTQLDKHNEYRSLHGVPLLVFNQSLNDIAQSYATTLFNAHKGPDSYSAPAEQGKYGENLYWAWRSPKYTYPPAAASVGWYSQIKDYNFTSGQPITPNKTVGHFTAMIWKGVTSAGFGFAYGPENNGQAIYVVVNYYPPPNYSQQYIANVLKPI